MENASWTVILFGLLFINPETANSKKVVLNSGNMKELFLKALEIDDGKNGQIWSKPSTNGNKTYTETCGLVSYFFTKHTNLVGREFADVMYVNVEAELDLAGNKENSSTFQVFVYRGKQTPNIPGQKMRKDDFVSKRNFTHVFNITLGRRVMETQTFSFYLNGAEAVTLAIKSSGSCGKISKMKLYYYYCEKEFINSVKFESTISPSNGSKEVTGNCANNSLLSKQFDKNLTYFKGFCRSNGTWQVDENVKCLCNKGFQPCPSQGCCACRNNHFKPNSSNANCIGCPPNSKHNRNKTSCKCNEGYHRRSNDRNSWTCVRDPVFKIYPECKERAVNITWNETKQRPIDARLETPYYVMCSSSCVGKQCNHSCSQVKCELSPAENISRTFKTWYHICSNLTRGTRYVFKVYSHKNSTHKVFHKLEIKCDDVSKSSDKPEDMDAIVLVIVGVVCILVLNATIILIVLLLRRRVNHRNRGMVLETTNQVDLNVHHRVYIDPTIYECPEDALAEFVCELDPSVIILETSIGGGEFGDVYKGHMACADGKTIVVAIKTLKCDATENSARDFMLEASVMGQFDDPNVVRLEGVVMKSLPRMIVIEFMSNGSLDHFLKYKNANLTQLQLIGMARDVASGMKYLSAINFVHRDLAARNILVDDRLLCKISDFGLSRALDNQESSRGEYAATGGKIPIRWTAPEAIKFRKFSSASDVWSYGILLWEIMTYGERPYLNWDNFHVMREVEIGYRLPAPKNCPRALHELMLQCWHENRSERPTFEHITLLLAGWFRSPQAMEDELKCSMVLSEWLQSIKMGNYVSHFIGAGFENPYQLSYLCDEDLREMGITLIGHRNKILKGVKALVYEQDGKVETPIPVDV